MSGRPRKILFACLGAPFWGEANAWAYTLFARMRRDGHDVAYANLLGESDPFFFRYVYGDGFEDPLRVGNVLGCTIEPGQRSEDQPALAELVRSCGPDLIVAWDASSALLLRKAAPGLPLILVLGESAQLDRLVDESMVRDWIGFRKAVDRGVYFPVPHRDDEVDAIRAADLIVLPTERARLAVEHFCRFAAGKIYARLTTPADLFAEEAQAYAHLRRPFTERDVDVLFVELDWRPRARNLALANRLAERLPALSIHLVGEHGGQAVRSEPHGAISRAALYDLLGRTRAVVFPSLADVGIGTALEASAMGCNLVASEASARAELCAAELRAPRCREADLIECIRSAVSRPIADRRDGFASDYADLVETLEVF